MNNSRNNSTFINAQQQEIQRMRRLEIAGTLFVLGMLTLVFGIVLWYGGASEDMKGDKARLKCEVALRMVHRDMTEKEALAQVKRMHEADRRLFMGPERWKRLREKEMKKDGE